MNTPLRQPHHPVRQIHHDSKTDTSISVSFGKHNRLYSHALRVRHRSVPDATHNQVQKFDSYSWHYVVYHKGDPVGTISVTRRIDGQIDCEDCYPRELMEAFGPVIETACCFAILRHCNTGFAVFRQLMRSVWQDRLPHGSRLHLLNASGRKPLNAYRRLGYIRLDDAEFMHPRLGTPSETLIMPADGTRRSSCKDIFQQIDRPLLLSDVLKTIRNPRR